MYRNMNDDILDGIIKTAFEEYLDRELEKVPSDEELAKMFPVSQKSLKKAQRRLKEIKFRKSLPLLYLQRAAIVVLVCVTVCFGVFMTSEKVRAALVDTVVEWFDKYVTIDFSKQEPDETANESTDVESTETITDMSSLQIGYIPEGFELTSSTEENDHTREYKYTSTSGDYLKICIYSSEAFQASADIELSDYEKISVNGNDAYFFYNYEEGCGSITFKYNKYIVSISCILDKTELVKVAENIK